MLQQKPRCVAGRRARDMARLACKPVAWRHSRRHMATVRAAGLSGYRRWYGETYVWQKAAVLLGVGRWRTTESGEMGAVASAGHQSYHQQRQRPPVSINTSTIIYHQSQKCTYGENNRISRHQNNIRMYR